MSAKVKPIPDGFNSVNAYLTVPSAAEAIAFYEKAFGAKPGTVMNGPDGRSVVHAEVRIGNSTVMLGDENPAWGQKSAKALGGSPVSLMIYVDDVDAVWARAIAAGCTQVQPLMDAFWGDRYGKVADPFGLQWGLGQHKEDLTPEEVERRGQEFMKKMAAEMGACAEKA